MEYKITELLSYSGILLAMNVGFLMDVFQNLDKDLNDAEIEAQMIASIKNIKHPMFLTSQTCQEMLHSLDIENIPRQEITLQKIQNMFFDINLKVAANPNLRHLKIPTRSLSKYTEICKPFTRSVCDTFIKNKFCKFLQIGLKYENLALEFLKKSMHGFEFRKATNIEDTHNCVDIIALKDNVINFGIQVKPFRSVEDDNKWRYVEKLQKNNNFEVYFMFYKHDTFVRRKNGKFFVKKSEVISENSLLSLF
jgi:hypothetical protein